MCPRVLYSAAKLPNKLFICNCNLLCVNAYLFLLTRVTTRICVPLQRLNKCTRLNNAGLQDFVQQFKPITSAWMRIVDTWATKSQSKTCAMRLFPMHEKHWPIAGNIFIKYFNNHIRSDTELWFIVTVRLNFCGRRKVNHLTCIRPLNRATIDKYYDHKRGFEKNVSTVH